MVFSILIIKAGEIMIIGVSFHLEYKFHTLNKCVFRKVVSRVFFPCSRLAYSCFFPPTGSIKTIEMILKNDFPIRIV